MTESSARDYWRDVLTTGSLAALPRWSSAPAPAVAVLEPQASTEIVAVVDDVAATVGVPVGAVLLAVHAKVMSLLSGEPLIRVGYRLGEHDLPYAVDAGRGTWRELIEHAADSCTMMARHGGYPVTELARELGAPFPLFETVADACTTPGRALGDALARIAVRRGGATFEYRADVIGPDFAARIVGYHYAALRAARTQPDAEHHRACLLSDQELRYQDGELAGRPRELPRWRFHELFEERTRRHPAAVAAIREQERLSYGELNERANQIAHALLSRGLHADDVIAVCAERHFDWIAAVIAIFKAGGVYLPVEPDFPTARITDMLSRSGCRLALADESGRSALGQLTDVIAVDELCDQPDRGDPRRPVGATQAAYIYFTSGSTGRPKGAVCEHAGMLNHLLAKAEDLGIGPGTRVAQTAPQCFDISLWQMLAPLLVGGTTVIIPQDVLLDLERFTGTLVRQQVEVLQVVPSYLYLLIAEFERCGTSPPSLRTVSVTGEALPYDLVRRWFDQCPQTRLVNAYGATEASDDTTHEVMERAPAGSRVSLGRPIRGARVHVVDENLFPVPLGAPGEIIFSGICVGRGYVNDEGRTRLAFIADPRHSGQRLYRSGDFGRWTMDGKLDFLGRRDRQVKIRGFRIEIGEIEERMLAVPGVLGAAVIVAGTPADSRLIACYCSSPTLPADAVTRALAEALPGYMVPSHFWWLDMLPLTVSGKVDRRALADMTTPSRQAGPTTVRSRTAAEERLAGAWAQVLGADADSIDPGHHFFDQGGTSLSALRLALQLDMRISLTDITRSPVFAELARRLDRQETAAEGLLHRFGAWDEQVDAVLLCFPYAGGNALNYRPLAQALRGTGIAVLAVEAPEPAGKPVSWVTELAVAVAGEVSKLRMPILVWGHSSGAASAVEAARVLRTRGHDVRRVYIGGQLPGTADDRRRSIRHTNSLSDAQVMASVSVQAGYPELAQVDDKQAARLAAAYRRDSLAADYYFVHLLEDRPVPLDIPISVVLAADDEGTSSSPRAYQAWRCVSEHVDRHELEAGGHYFVISRPAQVAAIIAGSLR